DVRDLTTESLRHAVAVVTQEVELFRASLRDNLTLFGTYAGDDDRLTDIVHRVGLGPWLAVQHRGLDTEIRGGQSLSAGEGQLLAFARAFLANPGVVLLDHAARTLDPEPEPRIPA